MRERPWSFLGCIWECVLVHLTADSGSLSFQVETHLSGQNATPQLWGEAPMTSGVSSWDRRERGTYI